MTMTKEEIVQIVAVELENRGGKNTLSTISIRDLCGIVSEILRPIETRLQRLEAIHDD